MYVYKLDTPGRKPDSYHHSPPSATTGRQGLLRRSNTYRENDHHYGKEDTKEMVQEPARKSVSVVEGRRRSVVAGRRSVGDRAEMDVGAAAAAFQVRVLVTDMPGFMQIHAFRCVRETFDSMEKFSPKQIALNLKKEFDKVSGPAWHCIVGSSFGSFVTHATGGFLYFSMEKLYILVFKTKVSKPIN